MKISLRRQEAEIVVLEVDGTIDVNESKILKAGLTKLFQSGKNKIILNFINSISIENDVIREIAILDIMAHELAGKIVLCSADPQFKQSILRFAKPPVVPFVASVEAALDLFKPTIKSEKKEGHTEAEKNPTIAHELHILKEKLKLFDANAVKKLQRENADLRERLQFMQKNVMAEFTKKRKPIDADGFLGKIAALEAELKSLASQLAAKEKK